VRDRSVALAAMVLAVVSALLPAATGCHAADAPPDTLSFEVAAPDGGLAGWFSTAPGTVFRDSTNVHGGRYSARFERGPSSPSDFSAISQHYPVTFTGDSVEVRGWLKTDGVTGFAGLWLREDGTVPNLQFYNMEDRGLKGTTPWAEYRIVLPLDRKAKTVVLGALLVGQGRTYVDDLTVLVDGKPLAAAPRLVQVPTAVETDREFDLGSRVESGKISPAGVANLALLGKVWGFVKYHHPRVAAAKLNWDYELFRVLPSVLAARDRRQAIRAIVRWLDRVGAADPCRPCAAPPESAQALPRIEWIRDRKGLGGDLSERLVRMHRNRNAEPEQYYVALVPGVMNPDFSNEESYARLTLPDFGYRLLALYRFWNIVEYWFPDRDVIGGDWDAVLAEFIPRLAAVTTRDAYRLEMIALVARVNDGHANVWNALDARPPLGECRIPIVPRPVDGRYVVGRFTNPERGRASGFRIGDEILAVDGIPVDSLASAWSPYYGASNESARSREIGRALTKGPCGSCLITVERAGTRLDVQADRDSIGLGSRDGLTHDLPGDAFQRIADDVAYLKLSSVKVADIPSYLERAAGTRCLVIDIRNYPSEFVPFELGQHLVDRPTPFARFTHGDPTNPGAFIWTEPVTIQPASPRYEGTVVILVDETSQSQAEYTAMALRAARGAIVVGSTTAGADGNVSAIPLPGGLRGMISGIGVYYPDKTPTQRIGIVPDLTVHPTVDGIRAGRDEVLEAALKRIFGKEIPIPSP
jgi:hypothetical protein